MPCRSQISHVYSKKRSCNAQKWDDRPKCNQSFMTLKNPICTWLLTYPRGKGHISYCQCLRFNRVHINIFKKKLKPVIRQGHSHNVTFECHCAVLCMACTCRLVSFSKGCTNR